MSELHDSLKNITIKPGRIPVDLYEKISVIKKSAETWLHGLGKNGYDHSERLEEYLDLLTRDLRKTGKISPAEVFILLCATYMHDIGYRDGGNGHAKRSSEMILKDPSAYHLGDFPPFNGQNPHRAAGAVACVCQGHDSNATQLEKITEDYPDRVFKEKPHLNLQKLVALLRLADEADDPYIRFDPSPESIRNRIPLVEFDGNNIIWYWDRTTERDITVFQEHLEKKLRLLDDSIQYLNRIGAGYWSLILRPQAGLHSPFMAAEPVETFVGREVDLGKIHSIIRKRGAGAITGIRGAGGIGKTELARMYAKYYRNEYPDGIFWASLKGNTWREEAGKIIAAATPAANPEAFADKQVAIRHVSRALVRMDALLIIDNVDEADDIIKPGCAVLITTRDESILHSLPREAIHELKSLTENEGIELLKKVLGEERVEKDPAGAFRLGEILGGMPLALDIAARHLREIPHQSFPDYIGEIQNKVAQLHIENDKDKDVRASLELSLDQLKGLRYGNKLLSLFEAAGVCAASGFTAGTLGAAAGYDIHTGDDVHHFISMLHFRSLLEYSAGSERYTMHPVLRQVAETRLKSNLKKEEKFKRNHCIHLLHYAEAHDNDPDSLIGEKDDIWQALIQADQIEDSETVRRQFLKYLSKPYYDLINRGKTKEAVDYLIAGNLIDIDDIGEVKTLTELLDTLITNQSALDPEIQCIVLNRKGLAYSQLGDYRKAIDLYERGLEIARRIGDVRGEGNALGNMGSAYSQLGEYRKAIDLFEKRIEIARRIGDVRGEGNALGNMGLAYADLGNLDKARQCLADAKQIFFKLGLDHMIKKIEQSEKRIEK